MLLGLCWFQESTRPSAWSKDASVLSHCSMPLRSRVTRPTTSDQQRRTTLATCLECLWGRVVW